MLAAFGTFGMSGSRRNGSSGASAFRTKALPSVGGDGGAAAPSRTGGTLEASCVGSAAPPAFGPCGMCAEGERFGARRGCRFVPGGGQGFAGTGTDGCRRSGPGEVSPTGSLGAPTVDWGAAIAFAPVEMLCRRKKGAGEVSPDEVWTAAVSPSESRAAASSEEVYQWTPIGVDDMVEDGGAGIGYEDRSITGAWWAASFGPLGPRRSMPFGGRGSGSVVRVAPWVAGSSP